MKIRNGFVSNSSSSSFCIFGTSISGKMLEVVKEEQIEKMGLELVYGPGEMFIGRAWHTIKDDETGKQFKDSIQQKVNLILKDAKCETIEEAWYDG